MCHSLFSQTGFTRDIHALPFKFKTNSLPPQHSHRSLHRSFLLLSTFKLFNSPMASTDLKQRVVTPDPATTTATNDNRKSEDVTGRSKREKRMVMAKRGLRSLTIAVALPLSLSVLSVYIASMNKSSTHEAIYSRKPFWFPPSWALHLMCPASSILMGLSAWMVWADGGFHKNPTALWLYLLQLLFTVLWDPVVFGAGTPRLGLILCLGMFGSMFGCMRVFGKVNPLASDLIKPCLAWIAFLFIVNLKLLFV